MNHETETTADPIASQRRALAESINTLNAARDEWRASRSRCAISTLALHELEAIAEPAGQIHASDFAKLARQRAEAAAGLQTQADQIRRQTLALERAARRPKWLAVTAERGLEEAYAEFWTQRKADAVQRLRDALPALLVPVYMADSRLKSGPFTAAESDPACVIAVAAEAAAAVLADPEARALAIAASLKEMPSATRADLLTDRDRSATIESAIPPGFGIKPTPERLAELRRELDQVAADVGRLDADIAGCGQSVSELDQQIAATREAIADRRVRQDFGAAQIAALERTKTAKQQRMLGRRLAAMNAKTKAHQLRAEVAEMSADLQIQQALDAAA